MVFSSAIFLFLFLPTVLTVYFILPFRFKNLFLLISSLVFYYWSEQNYSLLMLASIFANYYFAKLISYYGVNREHNKKKYALISAVSLNILVLVFFKYAGFIAENISDFISIPKAVEDYSKSIPLVSGISFYTFQSISYVVDVARGQKPRKDIISLALYISMFPQLIAGPIVRYNTIVEELDKRKVIIENFARGIERFIVGLAKKVIIANTIATLVDPIFATDPNYITPAIAWIGVIGYALQIYFDFSGYSDMAIGLGLMFGFHFPENFNYPYISKSITEFWRRWHITLSSWFRDYLYIPLGGNRKGAFNTYVNLFTVFTLCGLWHGASWSFLVWGVWHGTFLVLERTFLKNILSKLPDFISIWYTLGVVLVGWVFFRSPTLKYAYDYLVTMFGLNTLDANGYIQHFYISGDVYSAFILGVVLSIPIFTPLKTYLSNKKEEMSQYLTLSFNLGYKIVLLLIFFVSIVLVASSTYDPFIYYRF